MLHIFCLDSGQPPFKRQLLSEFDQTLDAKSSGLTPLKSCPNGSCSFFLYFCLFYDEMLSNLYILFMNCRNSKRQACLQI